MTDRDAALASPTCVIWGLAFVAVKIIARHRPRRTSSVIITSP